MKRILFTLLITFLLTAGLFAQKNVERILNDYNNPEELVTLSENLSFDQAISILSRISERSSGKKIIAGFSNSTPLGVPIDKMHFRRALDIIVQMQGLEYAEEPDLIIVKKPLASDLTKPSEEIYASVNSREIKISAVFFEADVNEMKTRGINWKWLLSSNDYSFGGEVKTFIEGQSESTTGESSTGSESSSSSGANNQQSQDFTLNGASVFDLGDLKGEVSGLFKFFESENLGEIIASPSITVRNTQKGRIQIGSDFSIKQRDFSGNVVDKFFSTGSIIEVTPYIYNEEDINYVLLNLMVDRSSALPSELSTEIKRTNASTQVLMLNGEETVIGGLFVNEESVERNGIPFLKDLPWWVFGIRYLTGSDTKVIKKKEVIILVKIDILPTLKERLKITAEDKIQKQLEKNNADIQRYKPNRKSGEK